MAFYDELNRFFNSYRCITGLTRLSSFYWKYSRAVYVYRMKAGKTSHYGPGLNRSDWTKRLR